MLFIVANVFILFFCLLIIIPSILGGIYTTLDYFLSTTTQKKCKLIKCKFLGKIRTEIDMEYYMVPYTLVIFESDGKKEKYKYVGHPKKGCKPGKKIVVIYETGRFFKNVRIDDFVVL